MYMIPDELLIQIFSKFDLSGRYVSTEDRVGYWMDLFDSHQHLMVRVGSIGYRNYHSVSSQEEDTECLISRILSELRSDTVISDFLYNESVFSMVTLWTHNVCGDSNIELEQFYLPERSIREVLLDKRKIDRDQLVNFSKSPIMVGSEDFELIQGILDLQTIR